MGDAEFKRVFEASPATRRSEWASVIIYSCLLALCLGVAGFLIVDFSLNIDLGRRTTWWLLILAVPLVISLVVGYLWSRSRCRFILALEETYVQAGPLCISYEDVDQVSLHVRDLQWSSTAIEITGHGKRICVRIGKPERLECAGLLRKRCRNAIFVDPLGHEYLPTAPTDAARIARVALARFRKRAWGFTYAAIASGAVAACMLYMMSKDVKGDWFLLVASIASLPFAVQQAIVYFKKARQVQEAQSRLEKQSSERLES